MAVLLSSTVVFAQDNDTSLMDTNAVDSVELNSIDEIDSKISINDVNNDSFSSNEDDSDLQYSSDNEDKLHATLTLTALKNLINDASGEVNLTDDYSYSSTADTSGGVASYTASNFILNGNGRTITYDRASNVNPKFTGSNIVLKNINFKYYNPIELSGSNISIIDCKFSQIQGSTSYILKLAYSENVNCFTFIGCRFTGGAGIYQSNYDFYSKVIIKDCNFLGQTGAWLSVSNAEINNTNFTNQFTQPTSSLGLAKFSGNVSFNNCNFDNITGPSGSAIINVDGSLNMSNVNFNYVNLRSTNPLIYMYCRQNLTCIWNNTLFFHVTANGAPMINIGYRNSVTSKLYILNSTFGYNYAGSLIRGSESKGTFNRYLINCTSNNNQYTNGVMGCIVYNSSFIQNTAFCGGAGTTSSFYNSYFYLNSAGTGGGAVHDPYVIKNCTFVENTANSYGGSIGINNTYHDILIENNTFLKSKAPKGGVFASYGDSTGRRTARITFTNNVVKNLLSTTDGGVIYTSFNKDNLTYFISNNDFNDISVSGCGGAFYIADSQNTGRFIVKDMDFINISARSGSVLYYPGSKQINCTFTNVAFLNNTATVNRFKCYGGTSFITYFVSENRYVNAINITVANPWLYFYNVTYWGANGVEKIEDGKAVIRQGAPGQIVSISVGSAAAVNYTTDEDGRIKIPFTRSGTYTVYLTHYSDNYYQYFYYNDRVEARGNSASLTAFTTVDGYNATITATVNSGITGIIKFTIENITYDVPISNSKAQLNLTNLDIGMYNVTVTYPGDETYFSATVYRQFKIVKIKHNSSLIIDATNITMGQKEIINFMVNGAKNVTISVVINSKSYEVDNGVLELEDLTVGNYTVFAFWGGDDEFQWVSNSTVFKVSPISNTSKVKIDVDDDIKVTLPDDAKGYVIIDINGTQYYAPIVNGTVNFTIPDLKPGTYNLTVIFPGDGNNMPGSNSTLFTIPDKRVPSSLELNVTNDEIKAILPDGATGHVVFDINGTQYYAPIVNGTASIPIPENLMPGTYNITARYDGDDNFKASSNSTLFGKYKSSFVNASIDDGILNVVLPSDAKGYVIIDINGTQYYAPIVDGKANFTIPSDLKPGTYNLTVIYPGDGNYTSSSNSTLFTISDKRVDGFIGVSVVDGVAYFVLPVDAKGDVVVDINGTRYLVPIVGGKANLTIPDTLEVGVYNLTASHAGDDKYYPSSNSTLFTISDKRVDGFIGVSVVDGVAYFVLPVDAKGDVVVDINGTRYLVPIVDGKGNLTIPSDLNPGMYNLTATFSGDDKYKSCGNSTLFTVKDKIKGFIKVNVVNGLIKVELPSDIDGFVVVCVNNTDYHVDVNAGLGNLSFPSYLDAGIYNITADFLGDNNYAPASNYTMFSYQKENCQIKVKVIADKIVASLPNDSTGYAIIDINGTKYYALINNGRAELEIPETLEKGNYTVNATYPGDYKYMSCSNITNLSINGKKIITVIGFERVESNLTVTGILRDVDGNVLKNKNLTYQINGGSKELICTDEYGIFTLRAVSHSTVNVEYAGNSIFKYCNATLILDKFLDIRNLTNIVSEAYDTYAVDFELGERGGYFNFRLVDENNKGLANKPVQIGFCGVIYNRVTDENGYAKLQINLNTPFIFTFAIAFLGDDTHNASFVVQQINVIKKTTTLSAKDMVFKASEKSKKFKVTLNSAPCSSIDGKTYISMGKTVTLNVAGKTYTAKTNALNQAIFKLDLTKKGSYNAKISFAGDVRYGASKTTAKIKIN